MQPQLDTSRYARSILSNSTRRDVLWNVSEPGDPYDIKKSMIAKLPGDKKVFMGEHLELVCLLQAAEIERLCEFLDEYKLKFREIERNNLDRHSYEVQIKELTEKVSGEDTLRTENNKLKEFSKRLQGEIQFQQRNSREVSHQDESYKTNYERTLERLNELIRENQDLRQQLEEYRFQIQSFNARQEALERAKNREIEDLKLNFSQFSKESYESSINSIRIQSESEIKRLEYEFKRLKEINDSKNIEISDLQNRLKSAHDELQHLSERDQYNYGLEGQIREYENKFVVFGTEIERLNIALRDYTNKLEESERRRRELDGKGEKLQGANQELEARLRAKDLEISHLNGIISKYEQESRRVGENQQFILEYESKLSTFARDNQMLNSKLKYEAEGAKKLREELERLTYENSKYRLIERENSTLKDGVAEIATLKKRIAELENKNMIMAQELERLQFTSKTKDTEIDRYRSIAQENESLKSRVSQLEFSYNSKSEVEISRIKSEYEQKFESLSRSQGNELQSRIQIYEGELERLKSTYKLKNDEGEKMKGRLYELEVTLNRAEVENSNKLKNYELNLSTLKRENEELYSKLKIGGENERKLFEYQNKLAQYEREIERLGLNLKGREDEIIALRAKQRELDTIIQKYEFEVGKSKVGYDQILSNLKLQNDGLNRKLTELVNESNKKLIEASQEIERLGLALRTRNEEKNQLEAKLKQLSQENEYLKQTLQRVNVQDEELKRRISQQQYKLSSISNDSNINLRNLSQENDLLKKQFSDLKNQYNLYEFEFNKKTTIYEQNNTNILRENQDLKRRVAQYENRFPLISQEIERLGIQLKSKTEEYNLLKTDYEKIKNAFKQYENDVNNHMEHQVKKTFKDYEQKIQDLLRENDEIKKRNAESILQFNTEFEKVNNTLRQFSQENQNLKAELKKQIAERRDEYSRNEVSLRQLTTEKESILRQFKEYELSVNQKLEGDIQRKMIAYQQAIAKLTQENDELRRKLQEVGSDLTRKLSESQNKYVAFTQEFEKLRANANGLAQENDTLKRKIEGYEASIANYEGEVKRRFASFEQNISALNKENEELRRRLQEASELNRKLAELNNTYDFETKKKYSSYEQTISEFNRRNTETEAKLNNSIQEIERLNNILRLKVDESTQQAIHFKTLTAEFDEYQRKVRENENSFNQNSSTLKRENDQLRRRLQELQTYINQMKAENDRKLIQIQSKFKSMSQEIERLSSLLKSKNEELETLKKQFKEYEYSVNQKFEGEIKTTLIQYENHINGLTKETEDLRRKLQEAGDLNRKLVEYENKIVLLSQEMERLNVIVTNKIEENQKLGAQNEQLRRRLAEFSEVNRRIPEYEQKIALILQENEKLQYGLRNKTDELGSLDLKFKQLLQENDTLKKNIANLEYSWSSKYESEVSRKTLTYEQNLGSLNREKDDLLRRKNEYESKIALLGQELERLNSILRARNEENGKLASELENLKKAAQQRIQMTETEFTTLQSNYATVSKEYETAKRHLQEYEQSIRKLYTEFERLQGIINELKKENQTLHAMNHNLSGEINRLTLENKDLEEQATEVRLRLTDDSALQKRINEHLALMVVLFAEIETLRNRVKDKEKEVAEVRRSSLAPNIL